MPALGSIMGANAVVSIRFAPIGHSIGCITDLIARIVPAIAAVRGRIVVMLDRIARLVNARDPFVARRGAVVDSIAPVKCRFGLNMGTVESFMHATPSAMSEPASVMPRTILVA